MKKIRLSFVVYLVIFTLATIFAGGWLRGVGACVAFSFVPTT